MATYEDWNKAIYEEYFLNLSKDEEPIFSVDKERIEYIGENELGISEDSVQDFCNSALNQMNKGNKLSLKDLCGDKNGIPTQTAVLAFFIYVASTMGGKDTEYNPNAYWLKLNGDKEKAGKNREGIIKKYLGRNIKLGQYDIVNFFKNLFHDFERQLSEKLNIKYSFENYFSYTNIGIPMTQAIITERDYCKLTKEFKVKETKKNEQKIIDSIISDIENDNKFNIKKYSSILRKCIEKSDVKVKEKITEKLKRLYKKWVTDGRPIEEFNEVTQKRETKSINLLYKYFFDEYGRFKCFYTAKIRKDCSSIKFSENGIEYELKKGNNQTYYENSQELKPEQLTLSAKEFRSEEGLIVKREAKDFIKFKKETNIYVEPYSIDEIKVGDEFSIISSEDELKELEEHIIEDLIYDNEFPESYSVPNTELYLWHEMVATDYDNDIIFFNPAQKLYYKKGLKIEPRMWIEGMPPIIENLVEVTIINENGEQETFETGSINLKAVDKFNKIGKYAIELEKSSNTKYYEIASISAVKPNEKKCSKVYHVLHKDKIERSEKSSDYPVVFGAYIDNISSDYDKSININNTKLSYILGILENHNNLRKYDIPDSIKKVLNEVQINCNSQNNQTLKKYLEENDKIDNYICIYLNRMKEVIYE